MGHIQGSQISVMEPFIKITAVSYFLKKAPSCIRANTLARARTC